MKDLTFQQGWSDALTAFLLKVSSVKVNDSQSERAVQWVYPFSIPSTFSFGQWTL